MYNRNGLFRKQLVAEAKDDPRFDSFQEAPAIFANDDLKYDANKHRARYFAERRGEIMTHSMAKDTPSPEAL